MPGEDHLLGLRSSSPAAVGAVSELTLRLRTPRYELSLTAATGSRCRCLEPIAHNFPRTRFIYPGRSHRGHHLVQLVRGTEVHEVRPEWKSIPTAVRSRTARYYLLDRALQPVPIGSGRRSVHRRRLSRQRLHRCVSDRRALPSPVLCARRPALQTGDLGRFFADGNIEFLGRNDFQVKIRGFRIELGEIESRMLEHPGVREAVVLAREEGGDKRLVAYYTVAEGAEMGAEALKAHLACTLASYMVPAAYVQLSALPLTPNGKLDRQGLPAPDAQAYVARGYEPPEGAVEVTLAGIWSEVLGGRAHRSPR